MEECGTIWRREGGEMWMLCFVYLCFHVSGVGMHVGGYWCTAKVGCRCCGLGFGGCWALVDGTGNEYKDVH